MPQGSFPLPPGVLLLMAAFLCPREQQASPGRCRPRQRADLASGQHNPGRQQEHGWPENCLLSLGEDPVSVLCRSSWPWRSTVLLVFQAWLTPTCLFRRGESNVYNSKFQLFRKIFWFFFFYLKKNVYHQSPQVVWSWGFCRSIPSANA